MRLFDAYTHFDAPRILYELLLERDTTINIAHQGAPTPAQHMAYFMRRPHPVWNLVEATAIGGVLKPIIGACYLTNHDEIGIFIFKAYHGRGYGPQAVKLLMEQQGQRRYLANISPGNPRSQAMFKRLGFNLIQHTYALET